MQIQHTPNPVPALPPHGLFSHLTEEQVRTSGTSPHEVSWSNAGLFREARGATDPVSPR
ncbi:hypothetical protein [Lentzea sp. CA-135723]|uniref:hypothetical protein n=1 Tax=Lentzea sp. CA-135723 TaxID=3239950 RepID=UPI003D8A7BF2